MNSIASTGLTTSEDDTGNKNSKVSDLQKITTIGNDTEKENSNTSSPTNIVDMDDKENAEKDTLSTIDGKEIFNEYISIYK